MQGDFSIRSVMRWYERAMPTIGDAEPYIRQVAKELAETKGVKSVYVWGSFADHIKNSKYNIKDIDLLTVCGFDSEDMLSIDRSPFGAFETAESELEDMGFDPIAVAFTKKYLKYSQYNIDQWSVSKDGKLLHWGPLAESVEEWKDLRKSAETNASAATGFSRKHLGKATEADRRQWKEAYDKTVQDYISGGHIGWYAADSCTKEILEKAIRLA